MPNRVKGKKEKKVKGNETKDLSKGKQWIECRETMEKQRETIDESGE